MDFRSLESVPKKQNQRAKQARSFCYLKRSFWAKGKANTTAPLRSRGCVLFALPPRP